MSIAGTIRFDDHNEPENHSPSKPVRKVARKKSTKRADPTAAADMAEPPIIAAAATPSPPRQMDLQLALAHDAGDIAALAERCGLSIRQLAERLTTGDDAAWRSTLTELLDAIAPIATRQGRLHAIRRLRQLADSDEHPETARKSCVDLAKLPSDLLAPASDAHDTSGVRPGSLNHEQERAVLALLNKLGQLAAARERAEEGTTHQAPGSSEEEEGIRDQGSGEEA